MRSLLLSLSLITLTASQGAFAKCADMFDAKMRALHSSKEVELCNLVKDKPVLIVNTASHCGYTPQFKGLEALHQKYKAKGLVVIGMASNDFNQEAKDEAKSASICYENFGVSFTMLAASPVKGSKANPVFQKINQQSKEPSWNFTKYVIDKNGKVVGRFGSSTTPDDEKLVSSIKLVL